MHRFTQKFLPTSFCDTWVCNSIRNIVENKIQLRKHEQLQHFHSNLAKLDIFPLFHFPKIWQDFGDEQIRIICKPTVFDSKLKKFFLDDLSTIFYLRPSFVSGLSIRLFEQLVIDGWNELDIVVFSLSRCGFPDALPGSAVVTLPIVQLFILRVPLRPQLPPTLKIHRPLSVS